LQLENILNQLSSKTENNKFLDYRRLSKLVKTKNAYLHYNVHISSLQEKVISESLPILQNKTKDCIFKNAEAGGGVALHWIGRPRLGDRWCNSIQELHRELRAEGPMMGAYLAHCRHLEI